MPNLYGVANAPNYIVGPTYLAGNVAIPANTTTLLWTSPALIAPSQGWFYPFVWITALISSGAAVNQGMNLYLQIGAGAWVNCCSMGANALVANESLPCTFMGVIAPSQVPWQAPGSTLSVGISGANNAFTVWQLSPLMVGLLRAPDQ